jgi:hypothetical protein
MPSQLIVVTAIAILQWLCILASTQLSQWFHPELNVALQFDPTTFLYGNLQIIFVLWAYQTILKYVKF